ncbi:MAG TPA: hypothetical protein DDY91_04560 [Planctomycetaceae bacterium]|jgi:hypothetical protein|nr:hypothetical protein [Planctomycetaceae bacterium]
MLARIRLMALWGVFLGWGMLPALSWAESVPSDRRLPKGTVAFLTIRNMSEFKTRFGQTMMGQMLGDPALQPLINSIQGKMSESLEQLQRQTGFSLGELMSIPEGEMTMSVTLGPNAGQFAMTTLMDFTGHEELFQRVLEKMQQEMEKNGVARIEEEVEGTPANLIKVDLGETPIKVVPGYCVKDKTFVFSTHTDSLKSVLTRWSGDHDETLASNDSFRYIMERCRHESTESAPLAMWYLDPLAIVRGGLSVDPQMAFQAAMAMGVMQQIGVDKLKGIGGSSDMAVGDYDGFSRTFLFAESSAKGVMNLMQFDEGAVGPPAWVTSDVMSFSSTRWNLEKAYQTVESLVDMFAGPGTTARQLDQIAENAETGNLHLKKDVVDQMTGAYISISDQVGRGEESRQRMLWALELKNANAMKGVLARLAGIEGFPGKQREFQGETIYEFTIPEGALEGLGVPNLTQLQAGADEIQGESTIGLAVADQRLMVALDVTLLEQIIRGAGDREPLSTSAVYQRVASRFPARAAAIGFNRGDLQLESMLEAAKSGMLQQATQGQIDLDIDLSLLPPAEVLKKYTAPSGSYMEADEKGLRWTSFTLKN